MDKTERKDAESSPRKKKTREAEKTKEHAGRSQKGRELRKEIPGDGT